MPVDIFCIYLSGKASPSFSNVFREAMSSGFPATFSCWSFFFRSLSVLTTFFPFLSSLVEDDQSACADVKRFPSWHELVGTRYDQSSSRNQSTQDALVLFLWLVKCHLSFPPVRGMSVVFYIFVALDNGSSSWGFSDMSEVNCTKKLKYDNDVGDSQLQRMPWHRLWKGIDMIRRVTEYLLIVCCSTVQCPYICWSIVSSSSCVPVSSQCDATDVSYPRY